MTAKIENTKLAITASLPAKTARVVVTGRVRFSEQDLFMMQHGRRFKLSCKVWGEDNGQGNWLDADDFLFSYASVHYPDSTPSQVENFSFDRTVPLSVINEDSGTDEVYAQVTLKDNEGSPARKQKSNVIVHQFST